MCETWVCTVRRDRNIPRAMSGVDVAPGDHGGDLELGRGERLPARGGPRPARTADAAPDAVGAKPAVGPPDVPAGLQALVQADGLVQRSPGLLFPAALGQDDGQVLQRGRQLHRRADRSVVRDSVPERIRI